MFVAMLISASFFFFFKANGDKIETFTLSVDGIILITLCSHSMIIQIIAKFNWIRFNHVPLAFNIHLAIGGIIFFFFLLYMQVHDSSIKLITI